MNDLPNRDLYAEQSHIPDCIMGCADSQDVLDAWVNGDLLTREEAALDPEVRAAVMLGADLDAAAEVMTQLTAEDLPAVTWHRAASRVVLKAALGVTDDV